jgi:aldehyde dehydrogenase (NAD+)
MPDTLAECGYALTVAIFGKEHEALKLAREVRAGTVLLNDLIAPTADARVPFGGARESGFGTTRGAEGLLEMTAVKTLLIRRGRNTRHFAATSAEHLPLFEGMVRATHAKKLAARWAGLRQLWAASRKLK